MGDVHTSRCVTYTSFTTTMQPQNAHLSLTMIFENATHSLLIYTLQDALFWYFLQTYQIWKKF